MIVVVYYFSTILELITNNTYANISSTQISFVSTNPPLNSMYH